MLKRIFLGLVLMSCVLMLGFCSCSHKQSSSKGQLMQSEKKPFVLDVYLENSGSLWGYVNGAKSEYRNFLHDFVQTSKAKGLLSGVRLNFISTQVTPFKGDVVDKLDHLSLADYSATTSQMIDMLGMVAHQHKDSQVSMFVSDCIFTSPNANVTTENLTTGIKDKMMGFLEKGNNSVIVYQLPCSFKGKYYSPKQGGMHFEGERPLYVWLLGDTKALARVVHELGFEKLQGVRDGYREFAAIKTTAELPFQVNRQLKGCVGSYRLVKGDKHAIHEARTANGRKRGFELPLLVDLSDLPFSDTFLADGKNYDCSSPAFEVVSAKPSKNPKYKGLYELVVRLKNEKSPGVPKGALTVSVRRQPCVWIDDVADTAGDAPLQGRTFGVQHMIHGLEGAYEQAGESVARFTLDIQ